MRGTSEQVELITDDISANWKAVSVHVIDYLAKWKLNARLPVNSTQQRLGLITFEKSKLEFTIKFQCWKCRSTSQLRNEFGIPFHLAFRNKMAKISSSHRDSGHLAAGGQLDFSHLLSTDGAKRFLHVWLYGKESRMDGLSDIWEIQNSMKFYYRTWK